MKLTPIQCIIIPEHPIEIDDGMMCTSLPSSMVLGGFEYYLSACIYGDGSHFIAIVLTLSDGVHYTCDGMHESAALVKYEGDSFPAQYCGKNLASSFYIRHDFCRSATL